MSFDRSAIDVAPAAARAGIASRRAIVLILLLVILVALAVVVTGLMSRHALATQLRERADDQSLRTVVVISPSKGGDPGAVELPGRTEAWSRAPIYSRVAGYLKRWHTDIGAPVKAGQLLAEVETPELDQQLLQAQAELVTARANATVADATAKRWQELLASGVVTRQGVDEKNGDLAAKQSAVRALEANVERNQTLKRFARIVSPFEGVVTVRSTDVGALIAPGGAAGSELFVVSDTRKLRVYVSVPQRLVAMLRPGVPASLSLPERPGKRYAASVQSLSQAITSTTGSMLVQLTVDNASAEILPGSFANVRFELPQSAGTLSVPPSALIFGKDGLRVATVGEGDTVVLRPVKVLRDLGTSIEIADGLSADDRVIESPPDGVEHGDRVRVASRNGAGQSVGKTPASRSTKP